MTDPFVTIHLPGPPRGKGRPRFRRFKDFVTTYTDKKTRSYEEDLAVAGARAMKAIPVRQGAVSVRIEAALPIPVSWSQKKRQAALAGDLTPCARGTTDHDNISKCVGDALEDIVWVNDSQIINSSFRKFYAAEPGLTISVWDWDG